MLQTWLFPQLQADSDDFVFQQDGAPPHWKLEVRRIKDAVNAVTPDLISNVWEEFDYRIDVCRAAGGGHIEHL
ncbi:unnamed protein product [Macrosiphum euphorbiae]|uniref:Uncharacterized protein n=1 Tax=Macrosiphum euphorbiae TaxID=13131 RepID=A0AAV0VNM6_9HEMI|nr:unnamed protein product [Macrosiphum euphorbiae]